MTEHGGAPDRPGGGQEQSQQQTSSWFQPSSERYRTQAEYRDPYEEQQKDQDDPAGTGLSDHREALSSPRYPNSGGYPGLGGYGGGVPGMAEPYPSALSGSGPSGGAGTPSPANDYPFDLPPRDLARSHREGGESRTGYAASDGDDDPGPGPAYDLSSRSYRPEELYPSEPPGTARPTSPAGAETAVPSTQGATYRLDEPLPEESSASAGASGYDFGLSSSSGARTTDESPAAGTWNIDTGSERGATYRLDEPLPEESSASAGASGYDFGLSSSSGARTADESPATGALPEWAAEGWSPSSPDSASTGYSGGTGASRTAAPADTDDTATEQSFEAAGGRTHQPPDPTSVYRIPTGDSPQSPLDPSRLVPPYRQQSGPDHPERSDRDVESAGSGGDGSSAASGFATPDRGESWEPRTPVDSSLLGGEAGWGGSSAAGADSGQEGAAASVDHGFSDRGESWEPRTPVDSSAGDSLGTGSGNTWVFSQDDPRLPESVREGAAASVDHGFSDRGESWEPRTPVDSSAGDSLGTGSGNTWVFSQDDPRLPESVRESTERTAAWSTDTTSSPTAQSDPESTSTWDALRTTDFASREAEDDDRWSGRGGDPLGEPTETVQPAPPNEGGTPETPASASADPLLAIANEQSRARARELASQSELDNWNLAEGIVKENTGAVPLPPDLSEEALGSDHRAGDAPRYDELGYDGRRDSGYDDHADDGYGDDGRFDRDADDRTPLGDESDADAYDSGWRGADHSPHDEDRGDAPDDDEYYDDVDDRYRPEPVRGGAPRASRRKDKIAQEFPGFTEPLGGTSADYPGYDNIDVWPETEGLATATLWLGIFSLLPGIGLLPAVIALVLGPKARRNIRTSRGQLEGEQLVKAGTVLAVIGIVVSVLTVVGYLLLF